MRRKLIIIVGLMLLFLCRPALADQSCYINTEAAGSYAVAGSPLMVLNPGDVSTPTNLNVGYTWTVIFRGSDPIGCKSLAPWDNAVHFITNAGSNLDTLYTTPEGNALIKTSVPGIDYTLELTCYTSDGCGGSLHGDLSLYLKAGNGTDNVYASTGEGYPWETADSQWRLKMMMWVTPEFKPKKGVPGGVSLNGSMATFQIGPSTQPRITFNTTTSSLNFSVPASTCGLGIAQGDTVSNNNVALGDYFLSDVGKDLTRAIPFSITLENCHTAKLEIKATSAYASANGELIGKSSGSASGMGVKVINTDKSVTLKPDGSTRAVYDRTGDESSQESLNFSAQLQRDGQPLKAGDFNAAATFMLDYE